MNKNIIIGVVVAALVLVLGYAAFRNNSIENTGENMQDVSSTVNTSTNTNNPTNTAPATTSTNPRAITAPTVQTNVQATISNSTALVSGKITPNSAITTWWFEYGESTSLGNLTTFEIVNAGQISTSVTSVISGLKPLTKYYFRINAQNQFGTVNGSISSFTTMGPITSGAPIIKTNNPTNISTSSVTMNGRLDPNDSNTTYWFEYSDTSFAGGVIGTITATQTMNGADGAIGVKADVGGLQKNKKYYYRMLARNEYGTVAGGTVSFRTK